MERTAEISLFGRGDKKGYHLGGDDLYGLTFDLKSPVPGCCVSFKDSRLTSRKASMQRTG